MEINIPNDILELFKTVKKREYDEELTFVEFKCYEDDETPFRALSQFGLIYIYDYSRDGENRYAVSEIGKQVLKQF